MDILRRHWRCGVALLLSAVMLTVSLWANPINVQAAQKTYISEVFVSVADTEKQAKKYLTDNGYTILNNDLCKGMSWGAYKSYYTYLGYKTTTDPEEAITDMAVMDMNGGYSYADYETLLEKQTEATKLVVEDIKTALEEYRANYTAGQENAVNAHDMLNLYMEDDSGELLGDFLLDSNVTDDQLTTLFMQANGSIFVNILKLLLSACGDGTPIIEKLAAIDPWEYTEDYSLNDDAQTLVSSLTDLRSGLGNYAAQKEKFGLTYDSSEAEIEAAIAELSETDQSEFLEYGMRYETLNSMSYGSEEYEMTWLDVFIVKS